MSEELERELVAACLDANASLQAMRTLVEALLATHTDLRALCEAHGFAVDSLAERLRTGPAQAPRDGLALAQSFHENLLALLNARSS